MQQYIIRDCRYCEGEMPGFIYIHDDHDTSKVIGAIPCPVCKMSAKVVERVEVVYA